MHLFPVYLFLLFILQRAEPDEHNHQYSNGDRVVMWYQNFFPENNQLETYRIEDFSFCRGTHFMPEHPHSGFLYALQGLSFDQSGLLIEYGVNTPKSEYCQKEITPFDVVVMSHAIRQKTLFEIYVDGLKAIGSICDFYSNKYEIYTNLRLIIHKNKDRIVKLELEQDSPSEFFNHPLLNFTYEVVWKNSLIEFENRLINTENSTHNFYVRLVSLFNSMAMMIILMCIALWILMRTLRYDIMRYNKSSNEDQDFNDQYGWKLLHRDVHRKPPHFQLLLALVGTGFQLFMTVITTALISLFFRVLYEIPRVINIGLYMYTTFSPLSAFLSSALYKKYGGTRPYRHILLHILLFPTILMVLTILVSLHARSLNINRYLDFTSFVYVILGFIVVIFPLSFLGFGTSRVLIVSERIGPDISEIPGPIPRRKWYLNFWPLAFFSGILPFGAFAVEMYFVLSSFWQIRVTLFFEFAIVCMFIMLGISVSANIISIYVFLNAEDYRWHWLSFTNGFTVGIYFILYTIFYHMNFTKISGQFQLGFYYSYSILMSISIGMICGAFNYVSSCLFIDRLYQSVKSD
ncbi:Transmembrane 9 superfamily member 3 [Thelohanellus kitauei]|uniref:Transmembrane 9 superfamily member n=1 Tax=Thelohanellus kitauei TaxID=669202 RepID=A0A0C2MSG3_THEKT|nr:Transmembrane 9 superfamily member 3 [Thelohanellus kitauei]